MRREGQKARLCIDSATMQRRTAKRDSLAGKPSAVEAGLQRDMTAEWDCRGDLPTCTCMGQYVTHQRDIKHRVLCHSAAGVQGGGESEEVGAGGGAGLTSNRRRRNKDVVDVAAAAVIMMIDWVWCREVCGTVVEWMSCSVEMH